MIANVHSERLTREKRFLKIISELAPDIPLHELRKKLAIQVLVFRGRTLEEMAQMSKLGYFADGTPEQREREIEYFRKVPRLVSANLDDGPELH